MEDDVTDAPQPLEIGMRNAVAVLLPNGWQVMVIWWRGGPEPVAKLSAWTGGSEARIDAVVPLGGTFQIADETWRLVEMQSSDNIDLIARIRRVEAGDAGGEPVNNIEAAAELRPFGEIGWEQITALNEQLPEPLVPDLYLRWLQRNNGAQPVRPCRLPGRDFLLTPERPLLGLHPDYPPFDFLTAQRQWRDPYLPPDHFVIAVPGGAGGLLVVHYRLELELIDYLPPQAMTGRLDPEERRKLLVPAAPGIDRFLGSLRDYEPPAGPPVEVIMPGSPRYWDPATFFDD
nr:DUF6406 domain-containing protein [Actinoplanes sp. RD1]